MANFTNSNVWDLPVEGPSSSFSNPPFNTPTLTYTQRRSQTHTQHAPSRLYPSDSSSYPYLYPTSELRGAVSTTINSNVARGFHHSIFSGEHVESPQSVRRPPVDRLPGHISRPSAPIIPVPHPTLPLYDHRQEGDRGSEVDGYGPGIKRRRTGFGSIEPTRHSMNHDHSELPLLWQSYNPHGATNHPIPYSQSNFPPRQPSPEGRNEYLDRRPVASSSRWQSQVYHESTTRLEPSPYVYTEQESRNHRPPQSAMSEQKSRLNISTSQSAIGIAAGGSLGTRYQDLANNMLDGFYNCTSVFSSEPSSTSQGATSPSCHPTVPPVFIAARSPSPINIPPLEERFTGDGFMCKWLRCTTRLIRERQAGETDEARAQARLQIAVQQHLYEHTKPSGVCLWDRCMKGEGHKRGRVAQSHQGQLEIPLDNRRMFSDPRNLRRHIFSCHLDVRFRCGIGSCVQVFSRESALRRHRDACTGSQKETKGKKRAKT